MVWKIGLNAVVWTLALLKANSTLLLPDSPPRGFNTFDNYGSINETEVLKLAQIFREQFPETYTTFTIDGGWSISRVKLENGTTIQRQHLDEYGRAIPAPERYPSGMANLAQNVKALGLNFGLWTIRGVHIDAVNAKMPIKGTPYTIDMIVDSEAVGGGKNGSCLWAGQWLGVNASHPAAQAYYNSRVELLVEQGVDFIKADCMMCGPCYTDEMNMFTRAVKQSPKELSLSYSPGGGNTPEDGQWVAENTIGTMYRTVTDFHGGWYGWGGLQQAIFIAGNFTQANLHGANGTWPDLDMLPLSANWWTPSVASRRVAEPMPSPMLQCEMHAISERERRACSGEQQSPTTPNHIMDQDHAGVDVDADFVQPNELASRGQTIATLWMIGRFPLFHAGKLPSDNITLSYLTNPRALRINAYSTHTRVVGYTGNNCTCGPSGCGNCSVTWAANTSAIPRPTEASLLRASSSGANELPASDHLSTAVAIINLGEQPANIWTSFASLGIHKDAKDAKDAKVNGLTTSSTSPSKASAPTEIHSIVPSCQVTDIWTNKVVGVYDLNSGFYTKLAPHGSAFLQLTSTS